jgi:hypothetical protein
MNRARKNPLPFDRQGIFFDAVIKLTLTGLAGFFCGLQNRISRIV